MRALLSVESRLSRGILPNGSRYPFSCRPITRCIDAPTHAYYLSVVGLGARSPVRARWSVQALDCGPLWSFDDLGPVIPAGGDHQQVVLHPSAFRQKAEPISR